MDSNGIDYGFGKTNIDEHSKIRYGVIAVNSLSDFFWEEVLSNGMDVDYKEFTESITQDLERSIKAVLAEYVSADFRSIAEEMVDSLDFDYDTSTGDCTRYSYEKEGISLITTSDGSVFVIKSPYYALCAFCSPCAPGAGDLTSAGLIKTYCLGPDWFDKDNPMPYKCFAVDTNLPVPAVFHAVPV